MLPAQGTISYTGRSTHVRQKCSVPAAASGCGLPEVTAVPPLAGNGTEQYAHLNGRWFLLVLEARGQHTHLLWVQALQVLMHSPSPLAFITHAQRALITTYQRWTATSLLQFLSLEFNMSF